MLAKLKMQTRKIQLEKLSWYSLRDIFDNKDKEELIVLIYDRTEFIASVTLGDFQNIYSEADFGVFANMKWFVIGVNVIPMRKNYLIYINLIDIY